MIAPLAHSPRGISKLHNALDLAGWGLSVFPLKPHGKSPAIPTWAPYQAAAADVETIMQWWTDNPHANIAVATGEVSNVLVLDVDGEQGRETLARLEAAHGPLPRTWRSKTGKGFHVWFEYPAGQTIGTSVGKLGSGLDTRGHGGYVVAPGSIHENGTTYTWKASPATTALAPCPEWLVRLLDPPPPPPRQTPARLLNDNRSKTTYARRAIEGEVYAVMNALEGQRNDTLNRAAYSLSQLVAGGSLSETDVKAALLKAAITSGLTAEEAERTIRSGFEAGILHPRAAPEPQLRLTTASARDGNAKAQTSPEGAREKREPQLQPFAELDLSLLNDGSSAPPRLQLDHFGAWRPWISATSEAASAPADYVAGALIGATAAVIGNARWASPFPDWKEPTALWVALVGSPSTGKSPSIDSTVRALSKLQTEELDAFEPKLRAYEADKSRAQAEHARWQRSLLKAADRESDVPSIPEAAAHPDAPIPPRIITHDTTPEALAAILSGNPRGVLVARDELAGLIAGMERYQQNGAARMFFTECFGGRMHTVDRKHAPPIIIPNLLASILGGLQPDKFNALLRNTADDGLAARFLWIFPQPQPFVRPTRKGDPELVLNALRRLRSLPMPDNAPVVLPLDATAADIVAEWIPEYERRQRYSSGLLASWRGKVRGMMVRLALVLDHLKWAFDGNGDPPRSVTADAVMRSTMLFTEYFDPMACRIFGDSRQTPAERNASATARWIVDGAIQDFTKRDLYRDHRPGNITKADEAEAAISVLVSAGWIRSAPLRAGANAGRSQDRYEVNPEVFPVSAERS